MLKLCIAIFNTSLFKFWGEINVDGSKWKTYDFSIFLLWYYDVIKMDIVIFISRFMINFEF